MSFCGKNMSRDQHPVWTLYDKIRTACLNVKYYERRLQQVENINLCLEIILAISAPTSAVAKLGFWNTQTGDAIWTVFGIIAAVVAVVKPLLNLSKRIKEYEATLFGYRILYSDLLDIRTTIEMTKKYDKKTEIEIQKTMQREKNLISKCPETCANQKIKRICEQEVRQLYPASVFYEPQEV